MKSGEAKTGVERKKMLAIKSATSAIKDDMIVGLGTGSTAELAIIEIGRRIKRENLNILCVATSFQSKMLSIECGIPLTTLDEHYPLDIYIDGADEVDRNLNLLKGGWGSHTIEKIVAFSSKKFLVCVNEEKLVDKIRKPVPVELLSFSRKLVERKITDMGGKVKLRTKEFGGRKIPFFTENGNIIMDADFGAIDNPDEMSAALSSIPGVVEHGIFVSEDFPGIEVHVGTEKEVKILS